MEFFGDSQGILWEFFGEFLGFSFWNSIRILCGLLGNSQGILWEFFGNSQRILWGCMVGDSECVGVDFG